MNFFGSRYVRGFDFFQKEIIPVKIIKELMCLYSSKRAS